MPGTQDQPTKSIETRLGLVMYGGVALAIYINGVAREFFRAVRGNGVYKWLKALTDSDIVVDIISGTSAGGICGNGGILRPIFAVTPLRNRHGKRETRSGKKY